MEKLSRLFWRFNRAVYRTTAPSRKHFQPPWLPLSGYRLDGADGKTTEWKSKTHSLSAPHAGRSRKAFIRKWRPRHRTVTDSLEEAGDRLFTFTRLPPAQWRNAS